MKPASAFETCIHEFVFVTFSHGMNRNKSMIKFVGLEKNWMIFYFYASDKAGFKIQQSG